MLATHWQQLREETDLRRRLRKEARRRALRLADARQSASAFARLVSGDGETGASRVKRPGMGYASIGGSKRVGGMQGLLA